MTTPVKSTDYFNDFLSYLDTDAAAPVTTMAPNNATDITEKEVRALFEVWNSALATGDSRIVASCYTKSPVLLPTISDKPCMDYESVKDYFDGFLLKKPQVKIIDGKIYIGNGWASDAGIYEFTMGATGDKVKGRYNYIYVKEDGIWKIQHHHSSVMPEEIAMGKAITESEVRGLFDLWIASRYSKAGVLLPTVSDTPRTDFNKMSNVDEFHGFSSSAFLANHLQFMQAQEVNYTISHDYLLSSSTSTTSAPVTAENRHVLCMWSYQMIESLFSKLSKEISCIGMSYLDRFMTTSSERAKVALYSRQDYQLATVACLIIALKNRGGVKLDTDFVTDVMCQGLYTIDELDAMEMEILHALTWRLNGPSPHEFIDGLVRLLPAISFYSDDSDVSPLLLLSKHSKIRVEYAILDYELALQSSLSLAYAALLTSLSNRSVLDGFHSTDLINWMSNIQSIMAGSTTDQFIKSLEEIIETSFDDMTKTAMDGEDNNDGDDCDN